MYSSRLLEFEDCGYSDIIPYKIEIVSGNSSGLITKSTGKLRALMLFMFDGNCSVSYDGKDIEMSPKNMIVIKEGSLVKINIHSNTPFECAFIEFSGKIMNRLITFDNVLPLRRGIINELAGVFQFPGNRCEYIISCMFLICAEILDFTNEKPEIGYSSRVCAYIDKNYMNQISVEEIAESFSINRRYLSRVFKSKTGMTIRQYIINKRLSKAKELILQGYSVGEAATSVGYNDVFNFSRMFTRKYGKSPINFKRSKC